MVRKSRCALIAAVVAGFPGVAYALDGATPLQITPANIPGTDWRILELYTGGNTVTSIADAGYTQKARFDGIGAYAHDPNTVRVVFNHELASPSASVSYLDLNRTNLKTWLTAGTATPPSTPVATRIGTAYTSIVGSTSLGSFCSSALFEPNRFGADRGFASRAYMAGEEITGTGDEYAIDLDPTSPTFRTMFELTALPNGAWENVAQFDTGRTDKVGLLMFEDAGSNVTTGTAPLRMWIGNKRDVSGDGQLSFLEKNGLAEGTTYYWIPTPGGTAAPSRFTATGTTISGNWSTSNIGAMLFSKLEDGDISPTSGTLAAFDSQDQGTFTAQLNLSFNPDGTLNTGASGATVKLVLEEAADGGAVASFNAQDNLTWSTDNLIFTQEDGDTRQIWQLDPANPNAAIAIAQVVGNAGESSGIVDVSELFGYVRGSILLTDSHSNTLTDNQLVLMLSPNAALVPEPSSLTLLGGLIGLAMGRSRRRLGRHQVD